MSDHDPTLIRRWAAERGLSPPAGIESGRLAVTVDRIRIHLVALKAGEILVEARIADLPRQVTDRNKFLSRAMSLATARMLACPAALVVDPAGVTLKLQARNAAQGSTDDLDRTVNMVASEVEMWRGLL